MKNQKRILISRWITRIVGLAYVGTLLLFFIGEKIWEDIGALSFLDGVLLLLIFVFIGGVFLGFFRELWGGIVIVASIFAFYITNIIFSESFDWQFDLWFLVIPGVLYLIVYYLEQRKS
jgi:hypothetical protein